MAQQKINNQQIKPDVKNEAPAAVVGWGGTMNVKYAYIGNVCVVTFRCTDTANATATIPYIELPFTADTSGINEILAMTALVRNNNAETGEPGIVVINSAAPTRLNFYRAVTGSGFTTSANARIGQGQITIPIAQS